MASNPNTKPKGSSTTSVASINAVSPGLDFSDAVQLPHFTSPPPNAEVETALFGEALPSRSFICRPIFSYDVPEIENLEAKFVYNFFTRDERVRKFLTPDEQIINIDAANTSDIFYQVKNDQIPRYVKFSFTPANDPYAKLADTVSTVIRDNLDKLIIEGAGSTKYHTGVELLDTNLERGIYNRLSGSFTFINAVSSKDSPVSAANKLESQLNETGGLTGQSKKLILEAMGNMQPAGLSFAQSDVPLEIAQTSNDPLAKQTFSLKFNNLFMNDMIRSASRIPDKVFQDEIEALREISEEIQSSVKIDAEKVSEAEFENQVAAIKVRPFDDIKDRDIIETNHEITIMGYLIQRMEILPDETAVKLEPLFSDNPKSLYVIDSNIRYGGVYVYKIRTVCKVKSLIRDADEDDPLFDEMAVAEFLMASEGRTVSVSCFEEEPPPPPVRVKARLDPYLKQPDITWQFPLNKQRDIKRFQIFKRATIHQPFTLVCEYDFDDSMVRTEPLEIANPDRLIRLNPPRPVLNYLDTEFERGDTAIYAVSCVDAHGYSSNLSAQLEVKYDRFKNKLLTRVVSGENAPKPYPNLLLEEDAFSDAIKTSGHDRMTVFFDPEYYRVTRFAKDPRGSTLIDAKTKEKVEIDCNFLSVNPDKATYKIQILNVDLQKDQIVDIKIADMSGPPNVVKVADISKNNINFEFGVE